MKRIGKILIVAAVFTMALALSACGGASASAKASSSASSSSSASVSASSSVSVDATGVISGNSYNNKYLGVNITLPEGYTFADAEKIKKARAALYGNVANTEEAKKAFENGATWVDAYASATDGSYIYLGIESVKDAKKEIKEAKQYLKDHKEEIEKLYTENAKAIEDAAKSITVKSSEFTEGKLANGTSYDSLSLVLDENGKTSYGQVICAVKDGYVVTIAMQAYSEEGMKALANAISAS